MKLVLLKDVKHLGKVGEEINVKAGYARNYLLPTQSALTPTSENLEIIQKDFLSESCDEKEILNIIKKNYEQNNIILDPHTAVGVGAANKLSFNDCVVLSTAHPCKFPDVTKKAINKHENLPKELQNVLDKDEHFQVLKNNIQEVKNFVMNKI